MALVSSRSLISARTSGTPISGPLLQEKAKRFYSQLHTYPADGDFKASTGWLEKFKTRHGIRNLSIQGEKLSAAEDTVDPFLQKLHQVMEEKGLTAEQIYNAEETGLWLQEIKRSLDCPWLHQRHRHT